MIKILFIPLVVILSACSSTNTKWEALKDPNCPNDIREVIENGDYWSVGRVKRM
jgi:hypothetical protein